MDIDLLFFIILFSFVFFIVIILLSNSQKPYQTAFKNSLFGLSSLFLVSFFSSYLNLNLNINFFTAAVSTILGTPGVVLLMLLYFI
ncbi:MAG: pro-sigmaK processing inhibitor BofA family protein [Oscillospiraceae bacterium]